MGRPSKLQLREVLKRATNLFWLRGCNAVSIRDLEEELDLRAPAIYRRFKSKDQLLAQCLDFYIDTIILKRIRHRLESAEDPLDGLHDFFTSTLEPHGQESRLRGCLLSHTAAHADGSIPEVRDAIYRGWNLLDVAFQKQIERAQRTGQLDADLDVEAVSKALLISLQGLLTLVRAGVTDLQPGIDATFSFLGGQTASIHKP
ncbi:MAG: TetR/AcrR family transcriptional regulator [Myxococcota bacterium]